MSIHINRPDKVTKLHLWDAHTTYNIPLREKCHCGNWAVLDECKMIEQEWYPTSWLCHYVCSNGKQRSKLFRHNTYKVYSSEA